MRGLPMMRELGYPVIFDVTHSLQLPGAGDGVTAGLAEYIEPLARAGVAAGVDGVFMEVHENPARAKSDAANALALDLARAAAAQPCRALIGLRGRMADLSLARKVLETEAAAILALVDRLDGQFTQRRALVRECRGRVILTGMGKSGIICRKIAATLSSTGTPAFFLHPAEAIHGDLGVIQADDFVIAMSYSGETEELTRVLETIKRLGARLIAMTGDVGLDAGAGGRRRARLPAFRPKPVR